MNLIIMASYNGFSSIGNSVFTSPET